MPFKLLRLFLVFVLLVTLCISCGNSEEEARVVLNEALMLKNQAKFLEAVSLLRRIVSEYPGTKVATEAVGVLDEMRGPMLAQVEVLEKQGKSLRAKELCEVIVSEYPGTSEAITASRKLVEYCDLIAYSDLINAYTCAQAYFLDHPDGKVDLEVLRGYGFMQSKGTKIEFPRNTSTGFQVTSEHVAGEKVFTKKADGSVESRSKK